MSWVCLLISLSIRAVCSSLNGGLEIAFGRQCVDCVAVEVTGQVRNGSPSRLTEFVTLLSRALHSLQDSQLTGFPSRWRVAHSQHPHWKACQVGAGTSGPR
jgi:hypothetical protein